jgi:hypothetical protein
MADDEVFDILPGREQQRDSTRELVRIQRACQIAVVISLYFC